jgi:hypothetical protein
MKSAVVVSAMAVAALATGSAGKPRLVVVPKKPVVGQRSLIELRGRAKPPVHATIANSLMTVPGRVRLRRVSARLWRGAYVFPFGGVWSVYANGKTVGVVAHLPAASTFTPLGGPGCAPPSPANAGSHEARGSGGLWAQGAAFSSHTAVLDGVLDKQTKIIWRLIGSGELSLVATAPDGSYRKPDWLDPHEGPSTWTRPGNEWGSGWTFTQTGCWHIHATRQGASGDAWLVVRS